MSRANKKTLSLQVYETLQGKARFGHPKHVDKVFKMTDKYIYSYSTMKTYLKHCNYFIDFCKADDFIRQELGHKPRTLEECKPFVERFIKAQEERGLSAYTVKMELSALEKLYGEKFDIKTKATRRSDIKRSRGEAVRDKHFSEEKNADFVTFCRCTGVRRSEYENVKPSDLITDGDQMFLHIIGKGGRERLAPIIGTDEEKRTVLSYLQTLTGCNKSPAHADIHSYRADYATRIYKNSCPDDLSSYRKQRFNYTDITGKTNKGNDIYKSYLYVCRNDRKGDVLFRPAMIKASQALGHNRESVVGEHYIRL